MNLFTSHREMDLHSQRVLFLCCQKLCSVILLKINTLVTPSVSLFNDFLLFHLFLGYILLFWQVFDNLLPLLGRLFIVRRRKTLL